MIRIIDWNAVGAALLEFLFCVVFGLIALANRAGLAAFLLPIAVIAFLTLFQKLLGIKFDLQAGTVRFYSFWIRRRVSLTDIRDANCEFGVPVSPTRLVFALANQGKGRGRSQARQRTYMVNLSGSFGSRQLRFHHKRWRDRFLSILRDQASPVPHHALVLSAPSQQLAQEARRDMPFYMKSSIKVGPYRFEASQPGAELSAAKGGSRPDAHFIRGDTHGFRYKGYVKKTRQPEAMGIDLPAPSRIAQWYETEMIEVASGDVLQMRNEHFASILNVINAKVQSSRLSIILPSAVTVLAVIAGLVGQLVFASLAVLALPLWFVGRRLDGYRRVTVLLYELSEEVGAAYAGVTEAFDLMANCAGQWRIEAGTAVTDLATWKRHAGASHLVQKSPTSLNYGLPDLIASNITPPVLLAGGKAIYFLPDVALIQDGETYGAVGYADLSITWQSSNMTELGDIPEDAAVVGWAWEHPNKDGGPDRRYRENRRVPICRYEAMHIGSASGVNELFEFSCQGVGEAFALSVRCLPHQSVGSSLLALC